MQNLEFELLFLLILIFLKYESHSYFDSKRINGNKVIKLLSFILGKKIRNKKGGCIISKFDYFS